MRNLRQRAQAFLEQTLPSEVALNYEPDSLTEIFIRTYTSGQPLDAGLLQMGKVCLSQMDTTIHQMHTEAAREYFVQCRRLLEEILQEAL